MTSEMAPDGSGGGNTKPPRIPASKNWCFTYFVENGSEALAKTLDKLGCYYFGEEKCPSTGKIHLQGYIEFTKKTRPIESVGIKEIHWEKAKGKREANIIYCSKDGKVFTNTKWKPAKALIDPLAKKVLYDWQNEILEIIEEDPDDRKIYWYWEKEGCAGKTSLAKHIVMNKKALYVNGKGADIKCAIAEMIKNGDGAPEIVLFGFPRSSEGYTCYGALEEIKDGMFFSGKYESGMCVFNPPHIVVFANFKPDLQKLSIDRWVVREIEKFEN